MLKQYPNTKTACLVCGSQSLFPIAALSSIPTCAQPFIDFQPTDEIKKVSSTSLTAYQCSNCTHVQSDSPLVPYYKDVITTASLSPAILSARDDYLQSFCKKLDNPNPNIIEIGMYQGQYLRHLSTLGYSNIYGIENCPNSIAVAKANGVNCDAGYLLDDTFENTTSLRFDVILCFNFLEHIPDPFAFLEVIKNKIASSHAILYFTMPSFKYIQSQMLLQEFVPDHLSYFTPLSLATLLSRSCLNALSLKSINNDNDLEFIASYDRPSLSALSPDGLNSLIFQINTLLESACSTGGSVAFWGAGHRSLTLISQLKYSLISFIIDSATFKQDKFCPDTGLAIHSPSFLAHRHVDILFLSLPGSYANEVISSLRASCSLPGRIFLIDGNQLTQLNF